MQNTRYLHHSDPREDSLLQPCDQQNSRNFSCTVGSSKQRETSLAFDMEAEEQFEKRSV